MRILVLHGAGVSASYSKLLEIKKDFERSEIKEIEGKDFSQGGLRMEVGSGDLFSEKRVLIVNNLDSSIELINIVGDDNLTLVIYSNKNILATSKLLKSAKEIKAEIWQFGEEEEVSVFRFLDLLAEKKREALGEFEKLLKNFGGQYILTMIFYMLRRFVSTPKKLPPFVIKKMEKQKINLPMGRINELYKEALETDFKIKTAFVEERIGLTILVEKFLR